MPSRSHLLGGGRYTDRTIRSDAALFQSAGALNTGAGISTCAKAATTGRLLVVFVHSNDGVTPSITGFTRIGTVIQTGGNSHSLLIRAVDGSESSTISITGMGAGYNEAICLGYNGTWVESYLGQNGSSSYPGLAVTYPNSVEIVAMDWDGGSIAYGGPSGWVVRKNGSASSYNYWIGDRAATSASALTGSAAFALSGPGFGNHGMIACVITP